MTLVLDASWRPAWPTQTQSSPTALCLEDKFEVIREIGDGSFGSVALARVRTAGSNIARRGTMVAVKTMKKTFDTFNHCLELREVIFLRSLPSHPHLVPALDIFLDPMSKKLHIAMEYMDGNLYQLMKSRDHRCLDAPAVKSILYQIMSGLEHIHHHNFFHRDIKPENILVSGTGSDSAFKRYSALVTPPSTPSAYTIKIADFGLARETHSKLPYTTYVSTRWYRAPEVLLRAGEYSAPVDIWAVGAMAVEVATLKPLFPGGNEVDQVWRICEIMGSPGAWQNRHGARVGGGEWKDGVKLAQKLGFSFPKMAPHTLDTILRAPQWPASLCEFVTWCLMWDPKNRPTSTQALAHDYFKDAVDPLRPKSSSRLLGSRKQSSASTTDSFKDAHESLPSLTTKTSSWFRKSLIQREVSAPAVPQHNPVAQATSSMVQLPSAPAPAPPPKPSADPIAAATVKARPAASKRATWNNGPSNAAPIPILPTIRPISPLSDAVTAQATVRPVDGEEKSGKKIGRQLSTNSQTNHYAEIHRLEAERALNGQSGLSSPVSAARESFFSHLRKRARRFSGKHQAPMSPGPDDIEANASTGPWVTNSNRQSMIIDSQGPVPTTLPSNDFSDLDKALQNVRRSLEAQSAAPPANNVQAPYGSNQGSLKRQHSVPRPEQRTLEQPPFVGLFGRTRSTRNKHQSSLQYETPDEEDELLDEALNSAHKAARRLDRHNKPDQYSAARYPPVPQVPSQPSASVSYLTPSPSADKILGFDYFKSSSKPVNIVKPKESRTDIYTQWPTPPSDSEWAAAAVANIFAAGAAYR